MRQEGEAEEMACRIRTVVQWSSCPDQTRPGPQSRASTFFAGFPIKPGAPRPSHLGTWESTNFNFHSQPTTTLPCPILFAAFIAKRVGYARTSTPRSQTLHLRKEGKPTCARRRNQSRIFMPTAWKPDPRRPNDLTAMLFRDCLAAYNPRRRQCSTIRPGPLHLREKERLPTLADPWIWRSLNRKGLVEAALQPQGNFFHLYPVVHCLHDHRKFIAPQTREYVPRTKLSFHALGHL